MGTHGPKCPIGKHRNTLSADPFPHLGARLAWRAAYPAPYPDSGMGRAIGDCLARRRFPALMESRMKNHGKRRADPTRSNEAKAAALSRKAARIAKAFRIGAAMPSPVYG